MPRIACRPDHDQSSARLRQRRRDALDQPRAPDLARRLDEKAQEADRSRSAEIREARRAHLRDKPKDG